MSRAVKPKVSVSFKMGVQQESYHYPGDLQVLNSKEEKIDLTG
jgi:hypothetical protein